jgi:hypothetical protein
VLIVAESVWEVVRDVPACRLAEVPRRWLTDETEARGDEGRDQRLAALVSAYHSATSVLVGWRRASPAGPVEVTIGGQGLITEAEAGRAALSLLVGGARPGAAAGRGRRCDA